MSVRTAPRYTVSADMSDDGCLIIEYQTRAEANDAFEDAIKAHAFRVALFDYEVIVKQWEAE